MSVKTTKKPSARNVSMDLRSEYRFDYRKSRPNRFSSEMRDVVAVVLDPDVASFFRTSKKVNAVLRSVISDPSRVRAPRKTGDKRRAV